MIRGLYTSAAGMLVQMNKTDTISNNLANVNTSSFKKDQAVVRALPDMRIHRFDDPVKVGRVALDPAPYIGTLGMGAVLDEVYTNFSPGNIQVTSNPLDVAIKGEGFFQVETPQGIRYSRDGSFNLNAQGFLVTHEGHMVLGDSGPIVLDASEEITINDQGVLRQGGQVIDRLALVNFGDQVLLEKQGDNLYLADGPPQVFAGEVVQGALEGSNVQVVSEMVDLIDAFRAYEANQKVVMANDETLGRAVNDILKI